MTIGIVTDSNAQLTTEMLAAADVRVVPLPVIVNGVELLEGVDLSADDFYEALAAGTEVSTSQPSPGAIADVYAQLESQGCDEIVSIHVGGELSGTVNSARLAAGLVAAEVHIVDTGQASFSVGCAVLAGNEARVAGGSTEDVLRAANLTASEVRNVFVMGGLDLARASGRVDVSAELVALDSEPRIPVMTFEDGELTVLGAADDIDAATRIMCDAVLANTGPLRVGIGVADRAAFGFYDAFEAALGGSPGVELMRYRCGPTVGAFTGLGTVGACWCPIRP
ncbi:MAG: DegV family protein [Actinomycetota bacterium]|jgi:DegV family protein with EDD domain|nr:DegV family protein [Actinomycetota bacterium]